MKRDLDLLRNMMLRIEANTPNQFDMQACHFEDLCDIDTLNYHIALMVDAGFIESIERPIQGEYYIRRLTNSGCDYLDVVRNDSVWAKTKQRLSSVGGSASIEIVKAVAIACLKNALGI